MAQYEIDNVAVPIDFQESDIIQRTLQNAKNLLMCEMGEVPYDRYRGLDTSLFDLPFEEFTAKLAVYLIALMLFSWLGAMLGFDKVTQMILQIVNAAPGKGK